MLAAASSRVQRVDLLDGWLAELIPQRSGAALVAVGGLGRREPAPYGDLDLVLVHDDLVGRGPRAKPDPAITAIAEAIWYPIWDAGFRLDHSVRTVAQAVEVAAADPLAGLGLLDARYVAGDPEAAESLRTSALATWRKHHRDLLPALQIERQKRIRIAGDTASLVEPDLKEGKGGLRDVLILRGIAAAQLIDPPGADVQAAYATLLDARDALQAGAGQATDVLVRQEQGPVRTALGDASEDELLRRVASAARTISFATGAGWRRVTATVRTRRTLRRKPVRRPLAEGVVEHDGEVVLALGADVEGDAVLPLRLAAAAAQANLPIGPATLTRVAQRHAPMPEPWPEAARSWLTKLLAAGSGLIDVAEALDQSGLLLEYLPEWARIRALPQRHPAHLYTVDRHLVEAAAQAGSLTRRVRRPDLLLIGALLHDIGKGGTGDHSEEGTVIVEPMLTRMGLATDDVATVTLMVGQHLLLPHTAARRDPADPATIGLIAERIHGRIDLLLLLHALAEADARATGPTVWTPWRAHVIADLVRHVGAALAPDDPRPEAAADDGELDAPDLLAQVGTPEATDGDVRVGLNPHLDGFEVTVQAADSVGLLSRIAGVLALHQLEIRGARVASRDGQAYDLFAVRPRFGRPPEARVLAADLRACLSGDLPLAERLAAREQAYQRGPRAAVPSEVLWYDRAAESATVVEVRAADRAGLLYRLTSALDRAGVRVISAHLETLGADAVDVFYLPENEVADPERRRELTDSLRAAADSP